MTRRKGVLQRAARGVKKLKATARKRSSLKKRSGAAVSRKELARTKKKRTAEYLKKKSGTAVSKKELERIKKIYARGIR